MPKLNEHKTVNKVGAPIRMGEQHHNWKGDSAKVGAGRMRARVAFSLGPCETCGKVGIDRHHKDGNTLNNVPENIKILCRKCHMKEDGRLYKLRQYPRYGVKGGYRNKTPPIDCIVCGIPSKPTRRGRCHRCNEFFRRHGLEWSEELRFACRKRIHPCDNCGITPSPGWSKGRCQACRIYFTNLGCERPRRLWKSVSK